MLGLVGNMVIPSQPGRNVYTVNNEQLQAFASTRNDVFAGEGIAGEDGLP